MIDPVLSIAAAMSVQSPFTSRAHTDQDSMVNIVKRNIFTVPNFHGFASYMRIDICGFKFSWSFIHLPSKITNANSLQNVSQASSHVVCHFRG